MLTAPVAPLIIEPETDGQVVSNFDVHMEIEPTAWFDADGHSHQATTWQVRETQANGGATVWQALDVSDPFSKNHIHFGDGAFVGSLAGQTSLLPNRGYVLHVTFTDSSGEVSATSTRPFQTSDQTDPIPDLGTWVVRDGYRLELAAPAGAFRLPVNIAFVPNPGPNPDDPLYYVAELYGSIKVVNRSGHPSDYATGLLDYNPSGPFSGSGEQGMTGLAVDPATGDLFIGLLWNNGTTDDQRGGANSHFPKVERLHSNDGGKTMATRTLLLNMQPETQGQSHQISNLSIGPDGKLYVHMGDGFAASTAQNLDLYRGKVLRMNTDGTAPSDNPFYNAANGINARDYVFTSGHRNPFGGAWRASSGVHYVVENGSSLDRFVDLTRGENYGWSGSDSALTSNSLYVWNPATAPINIAFVQPQTFGGSLFPASSQDDAFVTLSGPTYASGPQSRGKRIEQFTNIDSLNASGKLTTGPTTLVRYNGSGRSTVAALAAGPDGLYFSDLYRDNGVGGPTAVGANVYRLRYVDFHPTSVTAAVGDGQVTLNWSSDPLAATHNVYRSIEDGPAVLVGSGVSGTSFTDLTAINGTHYHYYVRGVNAGGESSDSSAVHATPGGPPSEPPGTGNGLAAVYYNNTNFTGTTLSRTDATVNFNFANGSPAGSIAADTFSARWFGQIEPRFSETYTFTTTSDDGVRLWVNDQLLINQWNNHSSRQHTGTIALVAGQRAEIRLEYYENTGLSVIKLEWQSASQAREVVPQSRLYSGPQDLVLTSIPVAPASAQVPAGGNVQLTAVAKDQFGNALLAQPTFTWSIDAGGIGSIDAAGLYQAPAAGTGAATVRAAVGAISGASSLAVGTVPPGTGNGLTAVYFNNRDLTGTSITRTDPTVNFNFAAGSPASFIAADTFSARWIGQIEPRFTEAYTFTTTSDDGVRLWVNDQLLIDQWNNHASRQHSGTIALVAGERPAIRLEYYENAGQSVIKLEWHSASQAREVVPQSRLYSGPPIRVNFQPAAAPVPAGYLVDAGAAFGAGGGGHTYGWNGNNAASTLDRNSTSSPDQRYDTFAQLQTPQLPGAVWEIALPNGPYRVHLVSGDANSFSGVFKTTVEGVLIVDGTPTTGQRWLEGWRDILVVDGRLTVASAAGAQNNKLNFIDIIPLAGL
jgi:hypothetical protein